MSTQRLPLHFLELLKVRPEISFAYVHGSFVDSVGYHDVDVALYLDPPVADPFEYAMALSVELTRALHVPVDVQILNGAPLGFQHSVLHGELLFARDQRKLTDFIEHVGWEYMQFSHHLRDYLEAVTT
jgi:predicted nucleotidyltransferase